MLRFEGVVRVAHDDPRSSGKMFLGAFIERDDGARWGIDYDRMSPFHLFENRRVFLSGERYTPEGQAVLAPHFRVSTMRLAQVTTDAQLVEVGAEETLSGQFEMRIFPQGTKSTGESMMFFLSDQKESFLLAHTSEEPQIGHTRIVTARRVKPSAYIAGPRVPYLWITRIEEPAGRFPP